MGDRIVNIGFRGRRDRAAVRVDALRAARPAARAGLRLPLRDPDQRRGHVGPGHVRAGQRGRGVVPPARPAQRRGERALLRPARPRRTASAGTSAGSASSTTRATTSRCCWTGGRRPRGRSTSPPRPAPEGVRRRRHIRTRLRAGDRRRRRGARPRPTRTPAGDDRRRPARRRCWPRSSAGRTGRMTDIVETIQAEQDQSSAPPHGGVLVVQGGAGHRQDRGRAAPRRLPALHLPAAARRARGVLVVGPEPDLPALHRRRCCRRWARPRSCCPPVAGLFPGVTARPAGAGGGRRDQGPGRRWPTCWPPRSGTGSGSRTVRWC